MKKRTNRPRNRKEMLKFQVVSLESRRRMVVIKPDYIEMRKAEIDLKKSNNLKSLVIENKN